MVKTKSVAFDKDAMVCEWLDKHPGARVIAITQDRMWYTIFYKEYTDEDYMQAASSATHDTDSDVTILSDDIMQHIGTALSVRQDAIPQSTVLC